MTNELEAPVDRWYVAAHSDEVTREPLARTVMSKELVLYRKMDGEAVIMKDLCPHRWAPLSMGRVVDDCIQCLYHRATFDENGQCVSVGGSDEVPVPWRVPTFPVAERHGFVWVWTGNRSAADPDTIPTLFERIDVAGSRVVDDCFPALKAHYMLAVDNLFDSTHAESLHESTLGSPGFSLQRDVDDDGNAAAEGAKFEVQMTDDGIAYQVEILNNIAGRSFIAGLGRRLGQPGEYTGPVDQFLKVTWSAPCFFTFDMTVNVAGGASEDAVNFCTFHALTPETPTTFNYFYKTVEPPCAYHESLARFWHDKTTIAFNEDKTMIEAQQRLMGTRRPYRSNRWGALPSDQLGMAARGIVEGLIGADASVAETDDIEEEIKSTPVGVGH